MSKDDNFYQQLGELLNGFGGEKNIYYEYHEFIPGTVFQNKESFIFIKTVCFLSDNIVYNYYPKMCFFYPPNKSRRIPIYKRETPIQISEKIFEFQKTIYKKTYKKSNKYFNIEPTYGLKRYSLKKY